MEEKKLVPKRRFREFDTNWYSIHLEDIYNRIGNAFVGTATPYYVEQGHFYLQSNNVKNGKVNKDLQIYINDEFYFKQKKNWLKTGDLVMVQSGHVGHTAVISDDLNNTAAHALIMFKDYIIKTNPEFLNNQFQTNHSKKKIKDITTGNTIKHILASDMEKFSVNLTVLSEQQKIGEFFKVLDERIANQEQKIAKVKELKEAYLTEMFPQEGETIPKRRFEGFEEKWKMVRLSDITMYENGIGHENLVMDKGRYELINLNSISINGGLKSSGKYVNESTKLLKKDDLVMILSDVGYGDLLGKVALIPNNNKYVLNQRVALLRPNYLINSLFLNFYINADKVYFKNKGAGMSQLNISRGIVEEFIVKTPSLPEQQKIGEFFKNLDNQIAREESKLEKLKKMKEAYLEEMFV